MLDAVAIDPVEQQRRSDRVLLVCTAMSYYLSADVLAAASDDIWELCARVGGVRPPDEEMRAAVVERLRAIEGLAVSA